MRHHRIHTRQTAVLLACFLLLSITSVVLAQMNLTINIQSAKASPVPGKLEYQVELLLSVWGKDGIPIKNLSLSDFSVQQEGTANPVVLSTVEEVTDAPVSLVLVLDNSRWTGDQLAKARNAAANLVSRLGSADQAAVYSFNSRVDLVSDFTSDHSSTRQALNSINSTEEGSCLYDAVAEAVEKITAAPAGRRAVIVFTAGRDRLYGDLPCSKISSQQVIAKAASPTRIPIYSIGAVRQIDISNRQFLESMSGQSGGYVIYPTQDDLISALDGDFSKIIDQLKYQYRLTYITANTAGDHIVSVQAAIGSNSAQGNAPCFFPELPPLPQTTITSTDITPTSSGEVTPGSPIPTAEPQGASTLFGLPLYATIGAATLFLALAAVGIILLTSKKRKLPKPSDGMGGSIEGATIDSFVLPSDKTLAIITILASDDPLRIGEKVDLKRFPFTLGRSEDNDLSFKNDQPVSRHHAKIEYIGGAFTLSEVVSESSDGIRKYPTFGTYINEKRMSGDVVPLTSGAEIRLGNRVKLRFETELPDTPSGFDEDSKTMDGISMGESTGEVTSELN